jgi:hypothetical protein
MSEQTAERRSDQRYRPTNLDGVVLSGLPEHFREVRVRSISRSGLAIEVNIEDVLPLDAPLGQRVTLSFMLPDVAKIATVHAEVVRTYRQVSDGGFIHLASDGELNETYNEDASPAHDDRVYGLGLRFMDLSPEMKRQLERYLDKVIGEKHRD